MHVLFFLIFTLILFLEGTGIPHGREVSLVLILLFPYALFCIDFIRGRVPRFPQKVSVFALLFLFFSSIATLFSPHFAESFQYLLLYVSLFLSFLYCYNHASELQKYFPFILVGLSVVFGIYSLMLQHLIRMQNFSLLPHDGYQYVYATFGLHNHRGDFIVLAMLICSYWVFSKKYQFFSLFSLLVFLPFLLYSYSRSAMVSFVISLTVMVWYFFKKNSRDIRRGWMLGILVIPLILFFLFTITEFRSLPYITPLKIAVNSKVHVSDKFLFKDRVAFISQSLDSIKDHPFFGIGPNMFLLLSQKHYSQMGFATVSSHNIFLDIFVENGIPAGISFLLFIGYLLFKSKKTLFYFLFLAILIDFQSDYTFKIYSFFFLFFCILGIVLYNKEHEKVQSK